MLNAGPRRRSPSPMERAAAVIDVGSNTVRLLVARCGPGTLAPTHTERVRLGLGRELEEHGRLSVETGGCDGLGHGELAAATSLLPMCSPEAIAARFGVGKRRAPLLLAASLILAEAQRRLVVPLVVTEGGVREGALVVAGREAAAA
jgi:exopolyphosphatase/pppGpp-phosphohydrolase